VSWIELRVSGGGTSTRATVAAILIDAGADAVIEEADSVLTYVRTPIDVAALKDAVYLASPAVTLEVSPAADIVETSWTADVGIQRLHGLTVAPPWLAGQAGDPARLIVIEPAMAFGTGEHPSTRGALRLMQRVIRAGDRVADLGAGSAVLAIAAAKLGAARVAAIELDPDAIGNAEQNVRSNAVEDRVIVIEGEAALLLPLVAPVRIVLANIISSVLLNLLEVIGDSLEPDGRAVLAGLLLAERDVMCRAFDEGGWRLEDEDAEGDWWSATIARRG